MATPQLQVFTPGPAPGEQQALFINRDLSLVEFYRRVLDEALDDSQPPLERLRFLTIFSSLVDEFFMIRMSGLREKAGIKVDITPDGLSSSQQLESVRRSIREMSETQMRCLLDDVMPQLARHGISLVGYSSLSTQERANFREHFEGEMLPVLTPQAVDPSHPFPYISGGTLNLGLYIQPKLTKRVERALQLKSNKLFLRMKLPSFMPRLLPIEGREGAFVTLEDLVTNNIDLLIPEATASDCHLFRISRDADIELRESEAADLLEMMEQNLRKRRFGDVVRLEVSDSMPDAMVSYLKGELGLEEEDVYRVSGPMNIGDFSSLVKLNRPELKFPPVRTVRPEAFDREGSTFDLIRSGDVMLHHPYMPYNIITDFIAEAVEDPDVVAIKMCLYRLGAESPIPPMLIRACELGKQVTVLIELKARFDEDNNITWAKRLEEAGVHVIYGLLGLKTHAKNTLIIRREDGKLKRYVHAATGNYNPQTSAAYTDLGLLTADEAIGQDVTDIFNFLTAYSRPKGFRKLLVAPHNLRQSMRELIEREAHHAREGRPARIIAKLNRLADSEIVNALYEASKAGVQIDLIIRGICTLRPGIPGISENIRVRSIVGRLLEHSRVYYFENGGDAEVYMGSSDWMPRNLDRRVEVLTPVERESIKRYLRESYLESYLRDNVKARVLQPDGTYDRVHRADDEPPFNCQEAFQGDLGLFPPEPVN